MQQILSKMLNASKTLNGLAIQLQCLYPPQYMVDVFEAQMTCDECQEAKLKIKQDKVNNADSAFIFLTIQSQNQWSGWSGRRRWPCLVWSLLER